MGRPRKHAQKPVGTDWPPRNPPGGNDGGTDGTDQHVNGVPVGTYTGAGAAPAAAAAAPAGAGAAAPRRPHRSTAAPDTAGAAKVTNKNDVKARVQGLEKLLLSIHTMGAALTHIPELVIDQNEARGIAEAAGEVLKFYPDWDIPDKTIAWVNLAGTIGIVYGSRGIAIYNRLNRERRAQLPARVVPMSVSVS
jgi:hypothetical protein